MAIYEIGPDSIRPLEATSFREAKLQERFDMQRLLRADFSVVDPDILLIAEEFGEWTDSRRRIDLLGIDKNANIVVVELKRTEDGGHMELQALRYAAMVSTLTAERAVEKLASFHGSDGETAKQQMLDFLDWEELDEDRFGQDVRLILIAADFSRELTTSVMWLNERDLDIRCVRLRPYAYQGATLLDVQQVIPLPEVADYQVQVREKKQQEKKSRTSNADYTKFNIDIQGQNYNNLGKRKSIFLVVKKLVEGGTTPDAIGTVLRPTKPSTWRCVDGSVTDADEFNRLARIQFPKHDHRRWYLNEGDLFVVKGKTYAFTNQWGTDFRDATALLRDNFPQLGLAWTPCEED